MAQINKLIAILSYCLYFTPTFANLAVIINHCPFEVFVTSVAARQDGRDIPHRHARIAPNEQFEEPYQIYPKGQGGQSIKIHKTKCLDCEDGQAPIMQFEYTIDDMIWFDMSNVNCCGERCPISKHGVKLSTNNPDCQSAMCEPGEIVCNGAYLHPTDDKKTRSCHDTTAAATVELCNELGPNPPKLACGASHAHGYGDCNNWHLVQELDICMDLAQRHGIDLGTFYAWNPSVGAKCETLLIGSHVCVGK